MTARRYFDDIRRKRRHIVALAMRLDELRYQATGAAAVRYDQDRVQTTPANRMERILADLIPTLEEGYSAAIAEYHTAWRRAEKEVLEMENPIYSEILQLRYLQDVARPMRWEQIAVTMGYSYDRVRHLHAEALRAFERQYLREDTDTNNPAA